MILTSLLWILSVQPLSAAGKIQSPSAIPSQPPPRPSAALNLVDESGEAGRKPLPEQVAQNIKKLKESLAGLNFILNNQKNIPNRIELLEKKAFLHVSIVRQMGLTRNRKSQLNEVEKSYLATAEKILNELLKSPNTLSDNRKSSVVYLQGLIAHERDDFKLQQSLFIQALKLDSTDPKTGNVTLMVAEQYYDNNQFTEALQFYGANTNTMTDRQKDFAAYKTAWCYTLMNKFPEAEAAFLKVIENRRISEFKKDSLRDLAYIGTRYLNEQGIIDLGRTKITQEADRNDFYSFSLKHLFRAQTKMSFSQLTRLVLQNEKKTESRIEIITYQINEYRKDFVNAEILTYLGQIKQELESSKKTFDDKDLVDFRVSLQGIVEGLIFQTHKLYSGRMSAAESTEQQKSTPKTRIAVILEKYIIYYDIFFPESKNKIEVYQILLDLCLDSKVFACLERLEKRSENFHKEDKPWNDLRYKIKANRLILADGMYSAEPEAKADFFLKELAAFRLLYPQDPLIVKGLRKALLIYAGRNDSAAQDKALGEIYEQQKTPENLYSWNLKLFKNEQYKDVIKNTKGVFPENKNLNQLRIETYLKLAEKESKDSNFAEYENYIRELSQLNKDPARAVVIYADWLDKSLKLSPTKSAHALEVYTKIPAEIRVQPVIESFLGIMAANFVNEGDFARFETVCGYFPTKYKDSELIYHGLIYGFATPSRKRADWISQLQSLDEQRRSYLIGNLVLYRPEMALEYFRKTNSKSVGQPQLYYLALKLQSQSELPTLTAQDMVQIGDLAPKSRAPMQNLLDQMKKIKFPSPKLKFTSYNAGVSELVLSVKKTRSQIAEFFKKSEVDQQIEVAIQAADLESKTAATIENAPFPPALNEEQTTEYRDGIVKLAQEFHEQSGEYRKIIQSLQEQVRQEDLKKSQDDLPLINMAEWKWPQADSVKRVIELLKISPLQAEIYLDTLLVNPDISKKISDEVYMQARVGLLGTQQMSAPMRSYILQELRQKSSDSVIEKWRQLGPQPVKP